MYVYKQVEVFLLQQVPPTAFHSLSEESAFGARANRFKKLKIRGPNMFQSIHFSHPRISSVFSVYLNKCFDF